jgi:hypothetical protein
MWPSGNDSAIGGNLRQRSSFMASIREKEKESNSTTNEEEDFQYRAQQQHQRKKLVDMIQEDFPRTPSPVHMNQSSAIEGSTSGIHLLGNQAENSKIRIGGKKPFSISGSVDAVMAAALEVDDSDFGFNRLNLLPEEEEEVEVAVEFSNWGSNQQSNRNYPEPFVYATNRGSFTASSGVNPAPAAPSNGFVYAVDEGVKAGIFEDFRMNRSKRYELFDLKGMMIDFSTDQHGSRFIQQKLEGASEADKELVFSELYPMALQLMTDVFGNYVIQKFFEHGSRSQRVALARLMHGHVLSLSLQMYGCRVVQKALEHVPSEEQVRLVQELEGHVLKCVKDQNGNHVIQKCIECVPLNTSAPFLTASFLSQASTLAMHPYGCRVIQRIFEHGPEDHSKALLDELLKSTGVLIQDQYGNYVIQHVLEHGKPHERTRIINFLRGRLLEYSRHKFASNVVEKCVSFGMESERQALIEEVLTPIEVEGASEEGGDGGGGVVVPLHLMMRDQFANYVVQKMLEVVDGEQRDLLLACIKPQIHHLRKYTYGKHILAKVERMLGLTPTVVEPERFNGGGHVSNNNHGNTHSNNHGNNHSNSHYHHNPHNNYNHQHNHRDYHSAPNSPANRAFSGGETAPPHEYRPRPRNQRISRNDLNEFPPLSGSTRRK